MKSWSFSARQEVFEWLARLIRSIPPTTYEQDASAPFVSALAVTADGC